MKYLVIVFMLICGSVFAEEEYEYINGQLWAWEVVDIKTAKQAENEFTAIFPKIRISELTGNILAYAHRYIICPHCGDSRKIIFAGPFNPEYTCEKCHRKFDEKIGLYKWQKGAMPDEKVNYNNFYVNL